MISFILWHAGPLLGNGSNISNYRTGTKATSAGQQINSVFYALQEKCYMQTELALPVGPNLGGISRLPRSREEYVQEPSPLGPERFKFEIVKYCNEPRTGSEKVYAGEAQQKL